MKQLKNSKKIGDNTGSPSRTMRGGGQTTTFGGAGFINEENPINMLLFSNMKKTSLGNLA